MDVSIYFGVYLPQKVTSAMYMYSNECYVALALRVRLIIEFGRSFYFNYHLEHR